MFHSRGSSESAGAAVVLRVLLLITMFRDIRLEFCPDHCRCENSNSYSCGDGAVWVRWEDFSVISARLHVSCQGKNVTCSDFLQVNMRADEASLLYHSCPLHILGCMKYIVPGVWLEQMSLSGIYDPFINFNASDVSFIRELYWHLSEKTAIAVDGLSSWRSLVSLHIVNGKLELSPNKFKHNDLRELHLQNNIIKVLPAGCFKGLPKLKILVIENNQIEHINKDTFEGLDNLNEFHIQSTKLKTIETGTFSNTPKLRGLIIAGNPLQSLHNRLLAGLPSLEEVAIFGQMHHDIPEIRRGWDVIEWYKVYKSLYTGTMNDLNVTSVPEDLFYGSYIITRLLLSGGNIKTIPARTFTNLSALIVLDLSHNSIEVLFEETFSNLTLLKHLHLGYNSVKLLPEGIFSALVHLETLNLRSNNIHALPDLVFANLKSLRTLNLAENKISMLPDRIFNNLNILKTLDLSNNLVEGLSVYQLFGLYNLTDLAIKDNKISYIRPWWIAGQSRDEQFEIFERAHRLGLNLSQTISPFTFLIHLENVDLSGNKIRKLFNNWQIDMQRVRELNLSRNDFTSIQEFLVDFTSLNINIDLRGNNISEIVLDSRTSSANGLLGATSNLLMDSPIICDCNSFGLYLRTKGGRLPHEPQYTLDGSTCIAPPHLKGHLFKDVTATDLNCNLTKHCPSNCYSCMVRSATNEVIIVCPTIPYTLPNLRSEDFSYHYFDEPTITLHLHHQPQDISNVSIHTLNLTNAGIHEITFHPSDSLRILDVSRNNLATIPDVFFERNITLYISNNPLSCDCAFIKKLNNDSVADLNHVVCANEGKFTHINVNQLCNRNVALVGYICTGLMCGIFFLKISLAIYKHAKKNWTHISRPFLRHTPEYSTAFEKRLDAAKKFDLFISFAHEDTPFVRDTLLPKLEKDYNQNVCVHSRDWVVGDLIADQIIQSVENARRTIIILTEHFIVSEWAYLEFRTAHNLSIQEGRPRVIMILLKEDIANDERLSNDIKSYIAVNTYLLWDDPNFWRKLKQVLPRQGRK